MNEPGRDEITVSEPSIVDHNDYILKGKFRVVKRLPLEECLKQLLTESRDCMLFINEYSFLWHKTQPVGCTFCSFWNMHLKETIYLLIPNNELEILKENGIIFKNLHARSCVE